MVHIELCYHCLLYTSSQIGSLLRREGIYYSTLQDFQHQRASGRLEPRANAAKQAEQTAAAEHKKQIARLEARNRQLEHKLQQAELCLLYTSRCV